MIENYPNIKRALVEIAYDNGMVNRYNTEKSAVDEYFDNIKDYLPNDLDVAEKFLSKLSDNEINSFCNDPESRLLAINVESEITDRVLDCAFGQ